MRLGISSGAALLLLFASLIGSYFNIPVAYLPEQRVLAQQEIDFFGMRYVVPVVVRLSARQASIVGRSRACHRRCRGGVLLAIPSRANTRRRWRGRPIPGLGIAEPVFVPSVTTAIVAYGDETGNAQRANRFRTGPRSSWLRYRRQLVASGR